MLVILKDAGVIELVGGIAFLLGFYTRTVAFLLSGHLAFAYFIGLAPKGFFPLLNGGESAALFCFIFLYYAFVGGGSWSLGAGLGPRSLDAVLRQVYRAPPLWTNRCRCRCYRPAFH